MNLSGARMCEACARLGDVIPSIYLCCGPSDKYNTYGSISGTIESLTFEHILVLIKVVKV